MAFAGGVVGVAVGGTGESVTVGGTAVGDGADVSVAGMEVGILVMVMGVPPVAQPPSTITTRLDRIVTVNFLIISFLLRTINVNYRFRVP